MTRPIRVVPLFITTTGGAGVATGSATSDPINGEILAVQVDYTTMPATTDLTIATAGLTPPAFNILVLTNVNTDAYHLPRKQASDAAGAAITGVYDRFVVADKVSASVAQGDAVTNGVKVWIYYRPLDN